MGFNAYGKSDMYIRKHFLVTNIQQMPLFSTGRTKTTYRVVSLYLVSTLSTIFRRSQHTRILFAVFKSSRRMPLAGITPVILDSKDEVVSI